MNCLKWDNNEITIPTADVKESLHMLPWGYTAPAGATEKTRPRMIGNGWHMGTAMFLLFALLVEPTEARNDVQTERANWHRQGSFHKKHNAPLITERMSDSKPSTADRLGEKWERYCGQDKLPIIEHRSGLVTRSKREIRTALRSMGGEASPTLGHVGDLRVGERTCPSSLTADSGVRNGTFEGSLLATDPS